MLLPSPLIAATIGSTSSSLSSVRSTTSFCVDTTPVACDTPVVGGRPAFARAAAAKYDIGGTGGS